MSDNSSEYGLWSGRSLEVETPKESERNEFSELCTLILAKEELTAENVSYLLMYLGSICDKSFHEKTTDAPRSPAPAPSQTPPEPNIFSEILWSYDILSETAYSSYYPCVFSLISIYMKESPKKDALSGQIVLDQKAAFLAKATEVLRLRSREERKMGYLPQDVLEILHELLRGTDAHQLECVESTIAKIKSLENPMQELFLLHRRLSCLFRSVAALVSEAMQFGARKAEQLFSCAQAVTELEDNGDSNPSTLSILSLILCREIQRLAVEQFPGMCFYLDPSFPKMASVLVIKTRDRVVLESPDEELSRKATDFLLEVVSSLFHPCARIGLLHVELGSEILPVRTAALSLFGKVYDAAVMKCHVEIMSLDTFRCSRALEKIFSSSLVANILHLGISPMVLLSEKLLGLVAKLEKLDSLLLCEPFFHENRCSLAIETFFTWMSRHFPPFSQHLRYLTLSFPYSQRTFSTLSRISFSSLECFTLEFLAGSKYEESAGKRNTLTTLFNRRVFPSITEINILNDTLTEDEFGDILGSNRLIQTKYGSFYCPLGSSYLKQKSYSFRRQEGLSLNTGVLFILDTQGSSRMVRKQLWKGGLGSACDVHALQKEV